MHGNSALGGGEGGAGDVGDGEGGRADAIVVVGGLGVEDDVKSVSAIVGGGEGIVGGEDGQRVGAGEMDGAAIEGGRLAGAVVYSDRHGNMGACAGQRRNPGQ